MTVMTLETSSVDFVVFVLISTVLTVLVPIVANSRGVPMKSENVLEPSHNSPQFRKCRFGKAFLQSGQTLCRCINACDAPPAAVSKQQELTG